MLDSFDNLADYSAIWMPILASILTGAAIGFERELSVKSAGLRTHTLLCFASTLLMMAAAHQAEWLFRPLQGAEIVSDPTRMAHGILTGIGFLGAGVIFRQGGFVHGLTTAASLWMTSALGVLYGVGLWELAVTGTIATLVILVLFRVFHLMVPDRLEATLALDLENIGWLKTIETELQARTISVAPMAVLLTGPAARVATRLVLRNPAEALELALRLSGLEGVRQVELTPVSVGDQVRVKESAD